MILLLDNYDSFTFNIYQYLLEVGTDVVVRRNDQISMREVKELNPECIVISPGPGIPENAGISVELVRTFAGSIPLLGICLGHQAIAVAFGGKVIRSNKVVHGKASNVEHTGGSLFARVPSPFIATRYHSLIVDEASLPDALEVTARSTDGAIMAMAHRTYEIYGLQFHPESILTEFGKQILSNFAGSQLQSMAPIGY